jgi:hypothetical protein
MGRMLSAGAVGQKREGKRVGVGVGTAAARWQPAGALVAVALVEEDSRGGEQDRGRGRATRGVRPSRRRHWGGARAAVGGAGSQRQRVSRAGGARGRGKGKGSQGSM